MILTLMMPQLMGLEGVVSVGEKVQILNNINPGGGGEYLDQEVSSLPLPTRLPPRLQMHVWGPWTLTIFSTFHMT